MAQASESGTEPAESSPVFRGSEEGMDDLFDLEEPQPKYIALIELGGVIAPTEGFTVVASRAAVDEVLRDLASDLLHDGAEQVGLVVEVVVERAARHPGGGHDLLGAGGGEALLGEQRAGRVHQRLAGVGDMLVSTGGGHGCIIGHTSCM